MSKNITWEQYAEKFHRGDMLAALNYCRLISITEMKDYSYKWQGRLKSFLKEKHGSQPVGLVKPKSKTQRKKASPNT